ncbi:MAG: LON peptidase substrate-binding domain-containing protein, partial [Microthrixaceae bacterium]
MADSGVPDPIPSEPAVGEMAAFPLGTVLLPGQLLPLQVFEPRYRVMLFDLRGSDPAEFVVVLIERGAEVGGGDERSVNGCVAQVLDQQDLDDGRSMVVVAGTRVVHIEEWLDEDPYPRALVRPLEAMPWADSEAEAVLPPLVEQA